VGDNIYAMLGIDRGGYAEHAIVKDTEAAAKPSSLDHVTAAAVPLAGLTAWQGLFRHGGLAAGQKVLIHGGAGGVGHFAVQFAKVKGGHVATTVSEKHVQFVRDLGADQIIDYQKQRFEDVVRDVDLVFDLIGGETQTRSWKVLRNGGVLVSTVMEPPAIVAQAHGARGLRYRVQESGLELGEIGRLIDAGKVKPTVSKRFALAQAVEAQRQLEDGHTEGKIVLAIAA
jgi:NADPH:quinone reductase-like Zn-dependent oxidoreductase